MILARGLSIPSTIDTGTVEDIIIASALERRYDDTGCGDIITGISGLFPIVSYFITSGIDNKRQTLILVTVTTLSLSVCKLIIETDLHH